MRASLHRVFLPACLLICSAAALQANEVKIEAYPIPLMANVGWGGATGFGKRSNGKYGNVPIKPYTIPEKGESVLRMIGPRNGIASGQLLMKVSGEPSSTQVTIEDLKGTGAVFKRDRIEIRYAQYAYRSSKRGAGIYQWRNSIGSASNGKFEPLPEKLYKSLWTLGPLMREETCKIEAGRPRSAWFTCSIPKDAKPGTYKGTAKVKGGPEVPVELTVVNAVLPDRAESTVVHNVRPKWEMIASGNGVPLAECWKSEKFWEVVKAYLKVMGEIRQQVCQVGILPNSYVSSTGMVKWTRDGDNWSWDFTALEKYIQTYKEVLGTPRIVEATAIRMNSRVESLRITYFDKKTGEKKVEDISASEPRAQKLAVQFTRELLKSLAKFGLEKKLALGIWHDKMRLDAVMHTLLKEIPELKIAAWSHGNGLGGKSMIPRIGILTGKPNGTRRAYPYLLLGSMRAQRQMSGLTFSNVGIANRLWRVAVHDYNGVGFFDLARWGTPKKSRHDPSYSCYSGAPFFPGLTMMVYPMRDGRVVSGIRYEVFRELTQDFELLKQLRAKGDKTAIKTEMAEWLKARGATEKPEGKPYSLKTMSEYDQKHRAILTAAGAATTRGK